MKFNQSIRTAVAVSLLGAGSALGTAQASIVSYLGGIGVSVPNASSAANSGSAAWAPSNSSVAFTSEDSVGSNGYVGPGYGGQLYDLEALYVQNNGTQLIITGISGANLAAMPVGASGTCGGSDACRTFPIGDFILGNGTINNFNPLVGIEVTGQYYTMGPQGYTEGWNSPLAAGSIVDLAPNAGYEQGLSNWNYVGSPSQLAMSGWTGFDPARRGTVTWETINGHSAFQATLDLSMLGSVINQDYIVHWGEICGNDFLRVPTSVPEPATLALFAIGIAGLGLSRRRTLR